ncbi:hypothetical protein ABZ863_16780 [Saccharomonospora sp. NPDC046836]|uniref:hypothetical protein n=1 Tax=Saccharomonospora sp. NPDC046836 TaxID=3156921 RepID=UPI00340895D5
MSGYEVVIGAIERASACAGRAADGVRGVDLGGTLTGVTQGMPGGTAVAAARGLADWWGQALPAWVGSMTEHSAQLATAAQRYQADDAAAAPDLRMTTGTGHSRPI